MAGKWSNISFDRWSSPYPHSLPYRIFKESDNEVRSLVISYESSFSFICSNLRKLGATWESPAFDYGLAENNKVLTVKQCVNNSKDFANWMRLSLLMSMCSNVEIYIASIIRESIESDPGIIMGASHQIDGIKLLKSGNKVDENVIADHIKKCTKDTWSSRLCHIEKLFGAMPIIANNIKQLEDIRNLRNAVGHAFGRNIEKSQQYYRIEIEPIERISVKRYNKYITLLYDIVQEFDKIVTGNHIGCFEIILQYHKMYESIKDLDKGYQVNELKATLKIDKNTGVSKELCRGVYLYYNNL